MKGTTRTARDGGTNRRHCSQRVDVAVIGAGHAGLAISQRLSARGVDHVIFERGQVAQSWRQRWDSLSLLTPNWMFRLPEDNTASHRQHNFDASGYLHKDEVASLVEGYSLAIQAPVHEHTEVLEVQPDAAGYRVTTTGGIWLARAVVLASGACARGNSPAFAGALPAAIHTLNASEYRNPQQLPEGGVLVVGASATGLQLAAEINNAGHQTTLCVGEHVRMPRCYNARDVYWWLHEAGVLQETWEQVDDLQRARRLPSPQLIGRANQTLDLNALQAQGIKLTGRLAGIHGTTAQFAGSLANACKSADLKARRLLQRFDETARQRGMLLDETADSLSPTHVPAPRLSMDLASGEIRTVLWATGFRPDFSFLQADAFDRKQRLQHTAGVTAAPGIFVVGLNLLRTRASSFIYGASEDSAAVAQAVMYHLDASSHQPPQTSYPARLAAV